MKKLIALIFLVAFYLSAQTNPILFKQKKQYATQLDVATQYWSCVPLAGSMNPNLDNKVHQIYTLGNSLTHDGRYQTQLNTLLGVGWIVNNEGVAGNTTTDMLARFTTDILTPGNCEYLIIWAGINDVNSGAVSAATIEANLQTMYTTAYNAGIKVVAVLISPYKTHTGWTSDKQVTLDAVNTWITTTAINLDCIIDVYSLLEDGSNPDCLLPAYDSGDGLHLSAAGYTTVGTAAYRGVSWQNDYGRMIKLADDMDFEVTKGHWTDNGNQSAVRSTIYKHSGSASLLITATAAGDGTTNFESLPYSAFTTIVSGNKFTEELYAYGNTNGVTLGMKIGDQVVTGKAVYNAVAGTFTRVVFNFQATASTVNQSIRLFLSGNGTCNIDDVSLSQAFDLMFNVHFKNNGFINHGSSVNSVFGLGNANSSLPGMCLTYTSNNKPTIYLCDGTTIVPVPTAGITAYLNQDILISGLLDRTGNLTLYNNGVLVGTVAANIGRLGELTLLIGSEASVSRSVRGQIGEIQFVFLNALPSNAASIPLQLYLNKKFLPVYPNQVSGKGIWINWKNQGLDKSGNGNNLTPIGNPPTVKVKY